MLVCGNVANEIERGAKMTEDTAWQICDVARLSLSPSAKIA